MERVKTGVLMPFLSAHNIMLCQTQHVAREVRVERACEFYVRHKGTKLKTEIIFNMLSISGIRFLVSR